MKNKLPLVQSHLMGIHAEHDPEFEIDRPRDPYGTCLILIFRSDAVLFTKRGIESARPGDCVVHTSAFRQFHRRHPDAAEGYRNDWLHGAPGAITPMMKALALPLNTLIPTGQPDILAPFIRRIQAELRTEDVWSQAVIHNQMEAMLLAVARSQSLIRQEQNMTRIQRLYYRDFCLLREDMLNACTTEWSVRGLASRVNLSPERFSVLYKAYFGTTPYAEILEARIVVAKSLLVDTAQDIQAVARTCGWADARYFSRLFTGRVGTSPSMYRKRTMGELPDAVPPRH